MKRTQIKDAIRNIRKQIISFLSIAIVMALGVGIFLACMFGARATANRGNELYNAKKYHDISIIATKGVFPEDVEAVTDIPGIADAEAVFEAELIAEHGNKKRGVQAISLTERIDIPEVVEGKLPEKDDECAIEQGLLEELGLSAGDKLKLSDPDASGKSKFLKKEEFLITGVIIHPDNINGQNSGDGKLLLTEDAVDTEALDLKYTAILVSADLKNTDTFSKGYLDEIRAIEKEIVVVGKHRSRLRDEEIISASEEKLKEADDELKDAKTQLEDVNKQLANGEIAIDDARKTLAENKIKLDAAKVELDDAEAQLQDGKAQLDDAKAQLDDAKAQLQDGRAQLDAAEIEIEDYRQQLIEAKTELDIARQLLDEAEASVPDQNADYIQEKEVEYENALAEYNSAKEQFDEGEQEYREGLAEYNDSLIEYEQGYAEYEAGMSEYNVNLRLFEANKKSYEEGLAQYEEGLAQVEDIEKELESGRKEFDAKEKEYESGESEYESGREQLDSYQAGNWVLSDRRAGISWGEIYESIDSFTSIGNTFAVLFIFLSVLVCYATIGKIIDDQRRLVGTTRALGFTVREIFSKYLSFGCLAALVGCLAGDVIAYSILQGIIISKVSEVYNIGSFSRCFLTIPAVLAIVCGIAVAIIATWMACRKLLLQPVTSLMSGTVPATFIKKEKERKPQSRSLYRGLIFRNISTDIKRVVITIVSIAGSCILLLVGFSMKSSFTNLISRQFDEIINYDAIVRYLPERTSTAKEDIEEILSSDPDIRYENVYSNGTQLKINADVENVTLICADPDELLFFYNLEEPASHKEMRIPDGGVVIYKRLAEIYGLKSGDHISVMGADGSFHDTVVSGICNIYAGRDVFMSLDYAKEIFGDEAQGNAFLVQLEEQKESALEEKLLKEDSFLKLENPEWNRKIFQDTADSVDTVIVVMVIMAGIMAAVVLLNLIKIQLNQKKRELTIMRVNGFTTSETVGYILRENIITTIIGIITGVVAGNLVAQICLRATEHVDMQMVKGISVSSSIYAALVTLAFAAIMNYLALRNIKDLNLSDVND